MHAIGLRDCIIVVYCGLFPQVILDRRRLHYDEQNNSGHSSSRSGGGTPQVGKKEKRKSKLLKFLRPGRSEKEKERVDNQWQHVHVETPQAQKHYQRQQISDTVLPATLRASQSARQVQQQVHDHAGAPDVHRSVSHDAGIPNHDHNHNPKQSKQNSSKWLWSGSRKRGGSK